MGIRGAVRVEGVNIHGVAAQLDIRGRGNDAQRGCRMATDAQRG